MTRPLLEVHEVTRRFGTRALGLARGTAAVDGVSFKLQPGQTLGIVGESGSGKSTLLRMIMRLLRPTSGRILMEGRDIWQSRGPELARFRRTVQPVFQDPGGSFNPRQTLRQILHAPLQVHRHGTGAAREARVREVLELVNLSPTLLGRLPHQLSGGQKQRVAIARAVMLKPRLLLLDEPTSALDVSIQAQVLNLIARTRDELGLTCIFVSHNLAVIRHIADEVVVVRGGRLVEGGPVVQVFTAPQGDYTRDLIAAVPDVRRMLAERHRQGRSTDAAARQGVSP